MKIEATPKLTFDEKEKKVLVDAYFLFQSLAKKMANTGCSEIIIGDEVVCLESIGYVHRFLDEITDAIETENEGRD